MISDNTILDSVMSVKSHSVNESYKSTINKYVNDFVHNALEYLSHL